MTPTEIEAHMAQHAAYMKHVREHLKRTNDYLDAYARADHHRYVVRKVVKEQVDD